MSVPLKKTIHKKLSRLHLEITGLVQGVGFRPLVWQLAHELGLGGWVRNTTQGVQLEIEGTETHLETFLIRLQSRVPPAVRLDKLEQQWNAPQGQVDFQILPSLSKTKTAALLPDLATCQACLKEIFDPRNRRYRYPFTNCTHCGPRYSILQDLPYDRANTTMKEFTQCAECQREYEDPRDRRFHAQANACAQCGPRLFLKDKKGTILAQDETALKQSEQFIKEGKVLALKGLGGFHLMVDARNESAVKNLRERKVRPHKAFAVMFPDLKSISHCVKLSAQTENLLSSPAAPIVLLEKRQNTEEILAQSIAPKNPYLGVMLPYTPLHHLLLKDLNFPVVATSGNHAEEPICVEGQEAMQRLGDIADFFLDHNRPIVRPLEDSVLKFHDQELIPIRRARGYSVTLSLNLPQLNEKSLLAVGPQQKNTVALSLNDNLLLSPHLGDLQNSLSQDRFVETISDWKYFYESKPEKMVVDLHPDYASTQWAKKVSEAEGISLHKVQHHHAHAVACMAEHNLEGDVLAVIWDGVGLGSDGDLWGGEFLHASRKSFQRFGHFRSFLLPGGEAAIREPRRTALGLLFEIFGKDLFQKHDLLSRLNFTAQELNLLHGMLEKNLNCPRTCGVGRVFDAISALLRFTDSITFSGQAAMELEFLAMEMLQNKEVAASENAAPYPFNIKRKQKVFVLDWEPMIHEILEDLTSGLAPENISQKFHGALIQGMVQGVQAMQKETKKKRVVLSGGCFQNALLLSLGKRALKEAGFEVFSHQQVPCNDGGIALGQILIGSSQEW